MLLFPVKKEREVTSNSSKEKAMLNIIKLKGCQRCGGDLFLERDMEGSYVFCLQCSAVYTRPVAPRVRAIVKNGSRKRYAHA
jgi:hypothetical protein